MFRCTDDYAGLGWKKRPGRKNGSLFCRLKNQLNSTRREEDADSFDIVSAIINEVIVNATIPECNKCGGKHEEKMVMKKEEVLKKEEVMKKDEVRKEEVKKEVVQKEEGRKDKEHNEVDKVESSFACMDIRYIKKIKEKKRKQKSSKWEENERFPDNMYYRRASHALFKDTFVKI